ncbi:peptidase C25-like protein [Breznakibacter xylanolyticus]|uniref:Peptidase C25-like protein n=1 Tax=Breznakibacter xylanolyticus TaxID=990 RepID=A0A2W7NJP8_9BACT|nr:type IX secretion system sortase PorU [Breznakibacter xylanolyticus]PZX20681.1 peptidase C25-like protein [Breznakibacter xylanolyticus]
MRHIVFIIIIGTILQAQAMKSQNHYSANIQWLPTQEMREGNQIIKTLAFKEQTGHINLLPVIHYEIDAIGKLLPSDSIDISMTDTTWIYATPEENAILRQRLDKESPIVSYTINTERKNSFVLVTILPYREVKEGVFQKMVQFKTTTHVRHGEQAALKAAINTYTSNSVLASGRWIKIAVTETGIHKISYAQLSNWGFTNPSQVKVFGNGGTMLPRQNNTVRADDLTENAIWHNGDAIYFFAQGPATWNYQGSMAMYMHQLHDYTREAYYFLSETGLGKSISTSNHTNLTPTRESTSFDERVYHENDLENIISSGIKWFGEKMEYASKTSYTIPFNIPDLQTDQPLKIFTTAAGRSASTSSLTLSVNDQVISNLNFNAVKLGDSEGYYAREASGFAQFYVPTTSFNITANYNAPSTGSICWLDAIIIQGRRKLKFDASQLLFRDRESIDEDAVTKFIIENAPSNLQVWDVTNVTEPMNMTVQSSGNNAAFIAPTTSISEFVAFNPASDLLTPTYKGEVNNQNIHGEAAVDYLIVTHPDFLEQANRLANLHQIHNELSTLVVTTDMVYNEFSSGQPDITAIRSLAKMFYDRADNDASKMPKYLLLFGDGSFDNRTTSPYNRILTFQSDNSIHKSESYVSDDYFGHLDDNEGSNPQYNSLDIGIGRLPVSTIAQAVNAVNKIENYLTGQSNTEWRTRITFVGDDGDSNTHMQQADQLATKVNNTHQGFDIKKIYYDAYTKEKLASGDKYPQVTKAINQMLDNGTLIFNYTGHGGPKGLSHEYVVTSAGIQAWRNNSRLPLFVTATCEFSRYDMKDETSAGEWVFLNPSGGGIALLTTTRIVYSNLNYEINNNFYDFVFEKDDNGNRLALGDIMMKTKRKTSSTVNRLNFTLLGDPALKLIYPEESVEMTAINNISVNETTPSLGAQSTAKIDAQVNHQQTIDSQFQGEATVTVYDKPITITTRGNVDNKTFTYTNHENLIFKGKVSVADGLLSSTFVVPQDIQYKTGNGKILFYAADNALTAFGGSTDISIGGFGDNIGDEQGPDIQLWLNDTHFVSGNKVGKTPILLASLFDENGINTTGSGIGHDLVATLTGPTNERYILNSHYSTQLDSYKAGNIQYTLPTLTTGQYTLTLKAWDTGNNSSEATIAFEVSETQPFDIRAVNLYPNPLHSGTPMSMNIEHNLGNEYIQTTVRIYNLSGQLMGSYSSLVASSLGTTAPVTYTPQNGNGEALPAGLYILYLDLVSDSGKKTSTGQKIMIR